jgi:uncharacterized protein (TIGR03083 family)
MAASPVPQAEQIHLDLDPAATLRAYASHRRRFAREAAALDRRALAQQSRCGRWSVADVLRHCADVDDWMRALWSGGPPPFTSFDANVTPHEFVMAGRSLSDEEARERYASSTAEMVSDIEASDYSRWSAPGVSPLGAVPWWVSVMHVFYDSWLHERDALLPLGIEPPVESGEVIPVLTYSLALAGSFVRTPMEIVVGGVRVVAGSSPVRATPLGQADPDPSTAPVIDALSGRGSLEEALPDLDPAAVHDLGALGRYLSSSG